MASGKILLLEDVHGLGKKGDICRAAAGYIRNYLLPKNLAMTATKSIMKLQEKLQAERAKQAEADKTESEAIAGRLNDITLVLERKADQDGHMYGSVTALDLVKLLQESNNIELDKNFINLKKPIKTFGVHQIEVVLKEGVEANFSLKVLAEGHPEQAEEATEQKEEQSE